MHPIALGCYWGIKAYWLERYIKRQLIQLFMEISVLPLEGRLLIVVNGTAVRKDDRDLQTYLSELGPNRKYAEVFPDFPRLLGHIKEEYSPACIAYPILLKMSEEQTSMPSQSRH